MAFNGAATFTAGAFQAQKAKENANPFAASIGGAKPPGNAFGAVGGQANAFGGAAATTTPLAFGGGGLGTAPAANAFGAAKPTAFGVPAGNAFGGGAAKANPFGGGAALAAPVGGMAFGAAAKPNPFGAKAGGLGGLGFATPVAQTVLVDVFKDLPTTGRKNVEAGDPLDQHVEDEVQHIYNQLVEHLRTEGYDEEEPKNKKTGQIKKLIEGELNENKPKIDAIKNKIDSVSKDVLRNQNSLATSKRDVDALKKRHEEEHNFADQVKRTAGYQSDSNNEQASWLVLNYYNQLVTRLEQDVQAYKEHVEMIKAWQQNNMQEVSEDEDPFRDVLINQEHVFVAMSSKLYRVHKEVELKKRQFLHHNPHIQLHELDDQDQDDHDTHSDEPPVLPKFQPGQQQAGQQQAVAVNAFGAPKPFGAFGAAPAGNAFGGGTAKPNPFGGGKPLAAPAAGNAFGGGAAKASPFGGATPAAGNAFGGAAPAGNAFGGGAPKANPFGGGTANATPAAANAFGGGAQAGNAFGNVGAGVGQAGQLAGQTAVFGNNAAGGLNRAKRPGPLNLTA